MRIPPLREVRNYQKFELLPDVTQIENGVSTLGFSAKSDRADATSFSS